jgi:hypothetical protein
MMDKKHGHSGMPCDRPSGVEDEGSIWKGRVVIGNAGVTSGLSQLQKVIHGSS